LCFLEFFKQLSPLLLSSDSPAPSALIFLICLLELNSSSDCVPLTFPQRGIFNSLRRLHKNTINPKFAGVTRRADNYRPQNINPSSEFHAAHSSSHFGPSGTPRVGFSFCSLRGGGKNGRKRAAQNAEHAAAKMGREVMKRQTGRTSFARGNYSLGAFLFWLLINSAESRLALEIKVLSRLPPAANLSRGDTRKSRALRKSLLCTSANPCTFCSLDMRGSTSYALRTLLSYLGLLTGS